MAVEKTLAYLIVARDLGITHVRGSRLSLIDFADTDYASKAHDRRSISGVVVILGGAVVCAISRTHHCVTLSTTKADYVAMADGVKKGVFAAEGCVPH